MLPGEGALSAEPPWVGPVRRVLQAWIQIPPGLSSREPLLPLIYSGHRKPCPHSGPTPLRASVSMEEGTEATQ